MKEKNKQFLIANLNIRPSILKPKQIHEPSYLKKMASFLLRQSGLLTFQLRHASHFIDPEKTEEQTSLWLGFRGIEMATAFFSLIKNKSLYKNSFAQPETFISPVKKNLFLYSLLPNISERSDDSLSEIE